MFCEIVDNIVWLYVCSFFLGFGTFAAFRLCLGAIEVCTIGRRNSFRNRYLIAFFLLFLFVTVVIKFINEIMLASLFKNKQRKLFENIVYYSECGHSDKKTDKSPKTAKKKYCEDYAEGGKLDVSANDVRINNVSVYELNDKYKYYERYDFNRLGGENDKSGGDCTDKWTDNTWN